MLLSVSSAYYPCSLDQTLASTIGTCRLATSRYLPSLAEVTMHMYVRSALFLEDVFPDGWTLRLGDGAEGLTPGVAAKREESPLLIRAMQGEQDTKAVSKDHVIVFQKPRKSDETRPGALSRHLRCSGRVKDGFFLECFVYV